MYAKLFTQMYDGTLCTSGPWQALVTFQQLLILADKDGVVDITPTAISRRTTIPIEIISTGIEKLLEPDPESRTPDEDGRRIVPLVEGRSWGWRIVNYKHYRALRTEDERREYHRAYWHKRKAEKENTQLDTQQTQQTQPNTTNSSKQYAVSSKQKETTLCDFPKNKKKADDLSVDFETAWSKYPARAGGNSKSKALKAWLARIAEGVSPEALISGVDRYANFIRSTEKLNTEYVKQAATFFGPDKHYSEEWRPPAKILKPNFENHHSLPSHKDFPQ